jgi:tetrahydromethanopterin S-methyltransferase subunit G
VSANEIATKDDLRELESRFDARFQAVSSRFMRVDNRFSSLDLRLNEVDHRHQTLAQRLDARFRSVDSRLDATNTRIDQVRGDIGELTFKVDHVGRIMLLGVVVSTVSLCLGTVTMVM